MKKQIIDLKTYDNTDRLDELHLYSEVKKNKFLSFKYIQSLKIFFINVFEIIMKNPKTSLNSFYFK